MKLYPDRGLPFLRYLAADLGILLWSLLCVLVGRIVYLAVMTLGIVGNGLVATGVYGNRAIDQVQDGLDGLPLGLGDALRGALAPLHGIPSGIVVTGNDELAAEGLDLERYLRHAAAAVVVLDQDDTTASHA